ncbi:MAG: endolytic transglycosylase MltG [Treponema sp.]|nr:endolytic transglycosylase MltG [Treponema sp.]
MSNLTDENSAGRERKAFSPARRILKLLSACIALVLVLFFLALGGVMYFNSPPEPLPKPAGQGSAPGEAGLAVEEDGSLFLEVKSGESAFSVGKRLEEAGIIRSRYFWYFLSRFTRDYIKTGAYRIELPASQLRIHSLLVSGDQILVRITVPEGVTLKKIARILEEAGVCGADAFLSAAASREILDSYGIPGKTMEGYLFPETYFFPYSFPAEKVIAAMAGTFFSRLGEIAPESLAMGGGEIFRKVIIASIVEREYRVDEEAPLMAGVFYNRLDIGMALQSCATVEYVITEIQGRPHPEVLYNRDIEIRDPYNTYMYPGLPPGPISVPGRTALEAAFNPASAAYLYFRLTDPDVGRHYFSRTFDDHIRAGALYVKKSS